MKTSSHHDVFFPLLWALEVAAMTTSSSINDNKVGIMMILGFQWIVNHSIISTINIWVRHTKLYIQLSAIINSDQYNKILQISLQKLRQNINQRLNPQKTPILHMFEVRKKDFKSGLNFAHVITTAELSWWHMQICDPTTSSKLIFTQVFNDKLKDPSWNCPECNCTRNQHAATCGINSAPPGQNGCHFADDIFRCIFMNERFCILIKISLKFVPKGSNW